MTGPRDALLEVLACSLIEPGVGFFVSQDVADPCISRPTSASSQTAMDLHNNSAVVARFFGIAKLHLAVTLDEQRISAKA